MKLLFTLFIQIVIFNSFGQNLIINELSQGPSGNKEFVEFVVSGTPGCTTPTPCLDLRGVVFDDNNGFFAPGAGSGIAAGAIRFANISFWDCIPQGTIIVVYNQDDIHPSIPPIDESITDGNCVLCLPISSSLFEFNTSSPTSGDATYPAAGWIAGGSNWSVLGMANAGDSFQIRENIGDLTPNHAVSWGNNTVGNIIYFSGSASSTNFSFLNLISNNQADQANWTSFPADGVFETPGQANNFENDTWIASLNPSCGSNPLTAAISSNPESCLGSCNGSLSSTTTGGFGPYSYSWNTGNSTSALSNLCAGSYTLQVTDANGCVIETSSTLTSGPSIPISEITGPTSLSLTDSPTSFLGTPVGGDWLSNCGTCITTSGVFDPSVSGMGTYEICYAVLNSPLCGDTACQTVVVSACTVPSTNSQVSICASDTLLFGAQMIFEEGVYIESFLTSQNCDSTHTLTVNVVDCNIPQFEIKIPNVISPNNDAINDLWEIQLTGGKVISGSIVNRWGEEIFKIDQSFTVWNGKNNRSLSVVEGVYTYILEIEKIAGEREIYHGFITIFR